MKKMILICETVTPLFLAGADGTTPELRAPSIKGALRFWWRAMNGHLSLDELRQQEGEIFGDTDKRSAVLLRILNESAKGKKKISLTPHHRQGYCDVRNQNCDFRKSTNCSKSFGKEGVFFDFDLMVCFNDQVINQQEIEQLVKVTFLLGGFGKRSRRGFGSIKMTQIDKKSVFSSLREIKEFVNSFPKKSDIHPDYPFIKNIEIGKSFQKYEDLLIKIGESSHLNKDDSLGYAYKKERFASPMYTSVIKMEGKFYPIITTLNTVFKNSARETTSKQNDYKRVIL